jgi:hypothetical protein
MISGTVGVFANVGMSVGDDVVEVVGVGVAIAVIVRD